MTNEPKTKANDTLAEQVGAKARRKLKARRVATPGVWFGLGMMGLIGWSVVVPTVFGAALGLWLDRRNEHDGGHSWTLALLAMGLALGCFNAWRWVTHEASAMRDEGDHE